MVQRWFFSEGLIGYFTAKQKGFKPLFDAIRWLTHHCQTRRRSSWLSRQKESENDQCVIFYYKNGLPLVMAEPQAGHHNNVYEIKLLFEQMCRLLEAAGISLKGIFMNADAGFDVEELREICIDKEIEVNIADNPRNSHTA